MAPGGQNLKLKQFLLLKTTNSSVWDNYSSNQSPVCCLEMNYYSWWSNYSWPGEGRTSYLTKYYNSDGKKCLSLSGSGSPAISSEIHKIYVSKSRFWDSKYFSAVNLQSLSSLSSISLFIPPSPFHALCSSNPLRIYLVQCSLLLWGYIYISAQPKNIKIFSTANYFWWWANNHEILNPTHILRRITNYKCLNSNLFVYA